jgi:RNA polymerase sigma factor (sigma-70 family)
LDELFKALYDRLLRTAVQVFTGRGSKNPEEDAKEAVQDWIVKMLDGSIAGYKCRTPFYVYAYTILVNGCLTIGRKTVRHWAASLPLDLAASADELAKSAELNEVCLILRGEMRRLPRRERRALIAKYWLNEKSKTAAARLGETEGTFNRLTHQGRERLRGRLAGWPELCRPF